jgi:hypothetical protein
MHGLEHAREAVTMTCLFRNFDPLGLSIKNAAYSCVRMSNQNQTVGLAKRHFGLVRAHAIVIAAQRAGVTIYATAPK